MSDQIFYLFSAVLLGLVVGALIMYFVYGANKDPDDTVSKLKIKLENYQRDVSDHFEQTADLVDEMTESYKKVFDHLGKSARKLMTEEQIQKHIEERKGNKVILEYLTESTEPELKNDDVAQVKENKKNLKDNKKLSKEEDSKKQEDSDNEVTAKELSSSGRINDNIEKVENRDDESVTDANNEKDDEESDLEQEVKNREKNIYS